MLLKKVYDEKTRTEKAWFDSSMFYYTKMVEDEFENKGNLFVTFKNGATYRYDDVKFEDYVVLIAGGTDASQGKTLNKVIKGKYNFERVADESIELLKEEYEKQCEKTNEKWVTYFISGHRDITPEEFEMNYQSAINEAIDTISNCKFVVGDYYGCDIMAQNYLLDILNIDPDRITVYHMMESPRNINPKVIHTKGGYQSDEERDAAMKADSFADIAFVRNWKKLSGTGQNILRRHALATTQKPE